ncbi:alpha/beta hydrolase family protein [Virgisporangium aliadipatigenens]|uniref:alpha/beta hydrolase family protein n=1 Tax=Virgisporangium aliadipatigenens TaxID=741659 RepID=UPI0019414A29|nr:alpha/beta hydrolase [Virgisporangium aliadipatigenens]
MQFRPWRTRRARILSITAALAVLLGAGVAVAPNALAAERGIAPTSLNITGDGGYRTASVNVSRLAVTGFGGGEIYYPTSTADGPYPAVAISPGFTAYWSSISWLGPRLASWGIVVIGIETNTTLDQPGQRGDQLLAALDYLTGRSSVAGRVDRTRLGVAGHSMGGGGTLEALRSRSSLKAGVPLAPWNLNTLWGSVRQPVMIVGGQLDTIAAPAIHSVPFYNSLGSSAKGYVEVAGGSHFFPQLPNSVASRAIVSTFKRYLDDDTRFTPFLCQSGLSVSSFRSRGLGC